MNVIMFSNLLIERTWWMLFCSPIFWLSVPDECYSVLQYFDWAYLMNVILRSNLLTERTWWMLFCSPIFRLSVRDECYSALSQKIGEQNNIHQVRSVKRLESRITFIRYSQSKDWRTEEHSSGTLSQKIGEQNNIHQVRSVKRLENRITFIRYAQSKDWRTE
jgi:hypothetical protein